VPQVSQRLVLLVDDYEDGADMYAEYLRFYGYQVLIARTGQEAVDLARSARPALILMDLEMPIISGLNAMRLIRSDESLNQTRIVALTAHALNKERDDAIRAGFDDYIAKPCLPDTLMAAIEHLLTTERQI
jgi:two-component system cell cycle response regulator DivK